METSPKTLEAAFHFNVATAHTLLQAAVPLMLEGGGGSAVNISSAMGRMADRGFVAYGTAKGALAHYTRLAATDLAPRIRVNAIAVGSVATSALDIVMQVDEMRTTMEDATPLGRIGDPEDIAAAIVYLSSKAGLLRDGQDPRGRRGHRGPHAAPGPARPLSPPPRPSRPAQQSRPLHRRRPPCPRPTESSPGAPATSAAT